MSDDRDQMISALKEQVVPKLKGLGFRGSFPHFRRRTDRSTDLLTFQFDKWGGGFCVEIGMCSASGFLTAWGEQIDPNKVRAIDVTNRFRLGAGDANSDYWFRYDSPSA